MAQVEKTSEQELIARLDVLTKQGQRLQVLKEITRIVKGGPSRTIRPALARLANRNHAYVLALRILHPIIREDRLKTGEAGAEVLNIYATSLMWIGALEEAQECLHRIKGSPDALLTEAFVHFAKWEYQKSMPLLFKYINSSSTTAYQKLVGQINLLAAVIAVGDVEKAKAIFEPLSAQLKSDPNYKLLHGNCLELRSQVEILQKSYDTALVYLSESEGLLSDQPGRYLLYVNKWKALAKLGLSPNNPQALMDLLKVKTEATSLKNWETIRDCDFHLARLKNDDELLQRILLGTPYQGYHDRMQSVFNLSLHESKTLQYSPLQPEISPQQIGLDLNQITQNSFLTSTSWPLLQVMTKDIYRPPRMGVVFNSLYKGEYFDPFTSPQRVRNSIFRFNVWAESEKCEFRIRITDGDFQFIGPAGVGITCIQRERPLAAWQAGLKVFKEQNQSKSFTTHDLAKTLAITPRNALTLIQKGLASKKLQKIGHGKNTRYIFFSGRRKTAAA
ncbi:MAG: hypothetical protein H7256_13490 [Bdellovibrio sp.]|nr:hypothetical protein [Bdellovibrio sp.]